MTVCRPMGTTRKEVIGAEAQWARWTRAFAKAMSKPMKK